MDGETNTAAGVGDIETSSTATDTTADTNSTTPDTQAPVTDDGVLDVVGDDDTGETTASAEFDPFAEPAEEQQPGPDDKPADDADTWLAKLKEVLAPEQPAADAGEQPNTPAKPEGSKPAEQKPAGKPGQPPADPYAKILETATNEYGTELADGVVKPLLDEIKTLKEQLGQIMPKMPVLDHVQKKAIEAETARVRDVTKSWFSKNKAAFQGEGGKDLWSKVITTAANVQNMSFQKGRPMSEDDALNIALAAERRNLPTGGAIQQIKGQMVKRSNMRTSAPAGSGRGGNTDPKAAFDAEFDRIMQ